MATISTRRALPLLAAGLLGVTACDLDLTDPNNPSEDAVISSVQGILQVAVGLQAEYSNEIVDPIYVSSLVADEVGAGAATFDSFQRVDIGEPIENNLGPSESPWAGMYDVVQIADVLLEEAPGVDLGARTLSGVLTLAETYKAMAFGNLLLTFPRIPLDVGPDQPAPTFASRDEGIQTVFALLESARQRYASQPPSETFNSQVLAPGIELGQLIEAMTARYALAFERYAEAEAAARRVSLDRQGVFAYTANDVNPLWNLWVAAGNPSEMRPEDRYRLAAEPGDNRVGFWLNEADIEGANVPLDEHDRFGSASAPLVVWSPDEMRLILAEVAARDGDLATAVDLVNEVRTPCSSTLDEPVACLPALSGDAVDTQAEVLDAILYERQYELFASGFAWTDLKRFGKPVKYQFMQVPRTECDRNPNAPAELCTI